MREPNKIKRWRKNCAWVIDQVRSREKSPKGLMDDFGGWTRAQPAEPNAQVKEVESKVHILFALARRIEELKRNKE